MKVLLLIIFLTMACKDSTRDMKIKLHSYNNSTEVHLTDDDYKIVSQKLNKLFYSSSEILRLYVEQTRINEIIQKEESVEFSFSNQTKFTSKLLGDESCSNLFIPLSGEFVGNGLNPFITIFIGDSGEYSEAIQNNTGYPMLIEIKTILDNYKN